ncbi:MAG TPA: hypothetical protein VMT91_12035 [Anaerolineales bacterium]|nr:hypothetical protein [Anaerolineales bacterium]
MRNWNLAPGDPLALTLAADFRLCSPDYINDQVWELEPGGGDPPALALHTTYGLRARLMRLFPRFTLGKQALTDPASFHQPPRLRRFYPNYLLLDLSPFPGLEVLAEYWAPDSHTTAGRFTLANRTGKPLTLLLELCGQLVPMDDGQNLAPHSLQSVNVLAGRTAELAPVVFITGGPQPGPGPFPSLALDLSIDPGGSRCLTWAQAALANMADSLSLARRTAARPWEAELARLEHTNQSQTIDIQTGDPDWDAALALSQKTAFGLFFGPSPHLPNPSFVLARQPDLGHSPRGDGSDYSPLWSGQSPFDAAYMASLLPGAPELAAGLLRNFLAVQAADGFVDWKPGLAGQRGRWLATPLLASLAWQTYQQTQDREFLQALLPGLQAFIECWFDARHDRDQDGFPEWDHPLQTGLEDNPAFTIWQAGGQGAAISAAESPALSAMLYREIRSLANIAETLGQLERLQSLQSKFAELRFQTEDCWDDSAMFYHNRDRTSHRSPAGKNLGRQPGPGELALEQSFPEPVRLLVRIKMTGEATRRPEVCLVSEEDGAPRTERLERMDFQWGPGLAVATSRELYGCLKQVRVSGLEARDQVSLQIMDFSGEDISLFLPLWAGIAAQPRLQALVSQNLLSAQRFWKPFGLPTCPSGISKTRPTAAERSIDSTCQAVHLAWNALVGQGLLACGLQSEAARLTARLMSAVILNLKQQHAFFEAYHAESGAGIGVRNPLQGLAPLGLFLETLGVTIFSPTRLALAGKNPFPWPVTVKYRGLTVTRQAEQTEVVFPDGRTVTLPDPTDAVISVD